MTLKLSVVIPAHNEVGNIEETVEVIYSSLLSQHLDFEILVVDDHSSDGTLELLRAIQPEYPFLVVTENEGPGGFGYAVRWGLERYTGDCVALMMADLSDSVADLVVFYRTMAKTGVDCVFGSRFIRGGKVSNYPEIKLALNRVANTLVRVVIGVNYNDFTNAFKLYKRSTIDGLKPFLSPHFNLTLELPLKAVVRGYSYRIIPNSWTGRKNGTSKLKIKEMGSRYFFILLYCLIEKFFSKGDYKKPNQ